MAEVRKVRRGIVGIVAITLAAYGHRGPCDQRVGQPGLRQPHRHMVAVGVQPARQGCRDDEHQSGAGFHGRVCHSGAGARIGPGNKYFFLTGTFGSEVERTVTVPDGKALFFPIINVETDNAVDPLPNPLFTVPELRAQAKASIDSATVLDAKLDGQAVPFFRVTSPVFGYTLPKKNSIYVVLRPFWSQCFYGRVKPAVGDGYWAYVPPLSDGKHKVEITSANSSGFSLHVIYWLTVK